MTPPDAPVRHAGNYRLLDAWRGVAGLWVVMLHVRLDSTPEWLRAISAGGHLGVPMFFVISGYCIANAAVRSLNAPHPVLHFLKARVRRIYPPYFFASLIAVLLSVLLSALITRHLVRSSQIADLNVLHQSWRFYLGALTLTQLSLHTVLIIRVPWSLCYEVAFYALVALLLGIFVILKRPERLLDALSLVTVRTLLWLDVVGNQCPFPWNLWPQFGLGALAYQVLAQSARMGPKLVFVLYSVLVAVYSVRCIPSDGSDGLCGEFQAFFTLAFVSALLLLFRWDARLANLKAVRLFSWVGLFSYSLYLIHLLALGLVTQGLNRIGFIQSHALLVYALKLVLCVGVGRLFFRFFERPFLGTR